MRSVAIILICLMAGCSRPNSEPVAVDSSAPPPAPALATEPAPKETGLYTDDEIRKLANFDIDKNSGVVGLNIFNIPCLDVVPNGESYPRARVFKTLNIDDARIRDFRLMGIDHVVFLSWQVSPSYDICCMTADQNNELGMADPMRKVYGIRLLARSK
jgi:hypothetical protein